MALSPPIKPVSSALPISTDPTAQKLAELEGRIAQLEGALSIGPSGAVTLKSASNITIDSSASVTIRSMSSMNVQAAGTLTMKGSVINLN